jgi:hypothetical protein
MNQLIKLILSTMAGFAGGVVANDLIKIRQKNEAIKASGQGAPIELTTAFTSVFEQPKLMRILIGTAAAVIVAILLMSSTQRKKLFR